MKNTDAATTTTDQTAAMDQNAKSAPAKPASKKAASKKKTAPKAKKTAKAAKPAKEAKAKKTARATPKEPGTFRPGSKGAKVLELISRVKGGSLAEIMKATDWQAHSVRGFISGTLGTKLGIKVESAKREDGERVYSLAK